MDRETLRSMAARVVDNGRMRALAERAGLYTPPESVVARQLTLLAAGVGLGALIMYMLDPDQGRRRRGLARDQVTSFVTDAEKRIEATARHLSNRARGLAADAKGAVREAAQPF